MPIYFERPEDFVLTESEASQLWQEALNHRTHFDDQVNIKVVTLEEITELNRVYRNTNKPTNVLAFSYPDHGSERSEHDIALCMVVAEKEAQDQKVSLRDYVALLLTHAFLHVTGMDHERSDSEAAATRTAEQKILAAVGFNAINL